MDPLSALSQMPLAIVLSYLSGVMVFLAKNWASLDSPRIKFSNYYFLRETFFWGFSLLILSLVMLWINAAEITDDFLENLPLNAGVFALAFGLSALMLRGLTPVILSVQNHPGVDLSKYINSIEKNPFPLFIIVTILCLLIRFNQFIQPSGILGAVGLFVLTIEIFKQFTADEKASLFFPFWFIFFCIILLLVLIFQTG